MEVCVFHVVCSIFHGKFAKTRQMVKSSVELFIFHGKFAKTAANCRKFHGTKHLPWQICKNTANGQKFRGTTQFPWQIVKNSMEVNQFSAYFAVKVPWSFALFLVHFFPCFFLFTWKMAFQYSVFCYSMANELFSMEFGIKPWKIYRRVDTLV